MKHVIVVFSWFCILAISCKKEREYIVSGTARNFYSGESVADAQIDVYYAQINYGTVSGGDEFLASANTDAAGQFTIAFDPVTASKYTVVSTKSGYKRGEVTVEASEWSTDRVNRLDLNLIGESQLVIKYVNQSEAGGRAVFKLGPHSNGCSNCCTSETSYVFEGVNDSTVYCTIYSDQIVGYTLSKIVDGVVDQVDGELEIIGSETLFNIEI